MRCFATKFSKREQEISLWATWTPAAQRMSHTVGDEWNLSPLSISEESDCDSDEAIYSGEGSRPLDMGSHGGTHTSDDEEHRGGGEGCGCVNGTLTHPAKLRVGVVEGAQDLTRFYDISPTFSRTFKFVTNVRIILWGRTISTVIKLKMVISTHPTTRSTRMRQAARSSHPGYLGSERDKESPVPSFNDHLLFAEVQEYHIGQIHYSLLFLPVPGPVKVDDQVQTVTRIIPAITSQSPRLPDPHYVLAAGSAVNETRALRCCSGYAGPGRVVTSESQGPASSPRPARPGPGLNRPGQAQCRA
ncbi:hypothetical protein K438DRAFT_1794231 [Mycena galopus ATCC 62051]|nr:hypothetical protein K438DRAFT_1794231 [Mycena galopus ATCC 62051]